MLNILLAALISCTPVALTVVEEIPSPELKVEESLGASCTETHPCRWFRARYLDKQGNAVSAPAPTWAAGPYGLYFNPWDEDPNILYISTQESGQWVIVALPEDGPAGNLLVTVP